MTTTLPPRRTSAPPSSSARRPSAPPPRRRPPARRAMRLGMLGRRLRVGLAAVVVLLAAIAVRLVQLQVFDAHAYAAAATAQRMNTVPVLAKRGSIVDRNGVQLAYTSDAQDVTVDPYQVQHEVAAADRAKYPALLAPLVGKTPAQVESILQQKTQYAVLATALTPTAAQRVTDVTLHGNPLVGVYTQATTARQYPGGTTAANVIGTVHSDGTGAAGIESEFNSLLAGKNGSVTYSVDGQGNINPSSRTVTDAARNGGTVALTIDQSLQYTAQQYLDQAVRESGAKDAEMVVLDAHTAQVLAMASSGTFDAANPNTINPNVPIDPPVMSAFEPGSVQKSITFAAALQSGLITPNSVFNVPDVENFDGVEIHDAWYHQTSPFYARGILAESSNVGTLQIAQKVGPTTWMKYEHLFGVGKKTGIELPGESSGYLPPRKDWSGSTFANLPFGQGESMTVLQLASIYQTIANNGVRVPPRIVLSTTSSSGAVHRTQQPAGIKVISPQTAKTLRTMLESVIGPGGTGIKAAVPGYEVAGKTGTAQQPDPNNGGRYSDTMNWDTFAGMIPADNPQFVVAIMVDNPAHGVEGGDVAAPLFNQIASYEVQHAHIAPTGRTAKYRPLQDCASQNPAYLPANVCSAN